MGKWISIKDVQSILSVSRDTVYVILKSNPQVRVKKIGNMIRINESDIQDATFLRTSQTTN